MIYYTESPAQTESLAEKIGRKLLPGTVIAFRGDLGAGKTAFVRGLARGLNITDPVTSPTYTVVNEYEGRLPLFHFDMYRLSSSDDLFDIGWEDYLARDGVICIEWSERVEDILENPVVITLSHVDGREDVRRIEILGFEEGDVL